MSGHLPNWADLFFVIGFGILITKIALSSDVRRHKVGGWLPILLNTVLFLIGGLLVWCNHLISPSVPYTSFKDAPEFSWWRRQVITHDISGLREYLASIGVPTPDKIPPFTVSDERAGSYTPPFAYQGELIIPRSLVTDRKKVTWFYMAYVAQKAIPDGDADADFRDPNIANRMWQKVIYSSAARDYYPMSYWGVLDSEEPYAVLLWKIRIALGQRFTDKLVSNVLRLVADSKGETIGSDTNALFAQRLKEADALMEADQQSWPKIQEILEHHKVNVQFDNEVQPAK